MKKLAFAWVFIAIAGVAQAGGEKLSEVTSESNIISNDKAPLNVSNKNLSRAIQICTNSSAKDVVERRGCCSHHGGVCGCEKSSDSIKCCDGTLSPSCTCSGY